MIRINRVEDVPEFIGLSAFTDYLRQKTADMLRALNTDSLEKYGSIYVIQQISDWDLSHEINLSGPIKNYPAEVAENLVFNNGNGGFIDIFHGSICLSNDFSIDVYCPKYLIPFDTGADWEANM